MGNAIVGSGVILAIATAIGVPSRRWARECTWPSTAGDVCSMRVRFTADVLNGVPSIVIGLVAYTD